jgi:hypothetical protein
LITLDSRIAISSPVPPLALDRGISLM